LALALAIANGLTQRLLISTASSMGPVRITQELVDLPIAH
jgi:hypothetical protein